MLIRDRRYALCFGSCCRILRDSYFGPFVSDLSAVFILVQIRCCFLPAVSVVKRKRHEVSRILLQNYSDICRTLAILIIIVIPYFLNGKGDLFRCMCIRKYSVSYRSGRYGSISCNGRLDPLISDQSTLVIELRKSIQFCRPVITVIQNNVQEVDIILSKRNRQVLRAHAILVIIVVPDLGDLHRCFFKRNIICIFDRRRCSERRVICLRVALRHIFLGPGIVDQNAVTILRKTADRCRPVVTGVQFDRIPVSEGHNDLCRALAGGIVKVYPLFRHRGRGGLRCVGVCDRCRSIRYRSCRAVSRRVICYRHFFPCIDVFGSSVILWKICCRVCPVIGIIKSSSIDLVSILFKDHHNFSRTLSILVIGIVPVLFYRQREVFLDIIVFIVYRYQIFRVFGDLLFCVSVNDTVRSQRIVRRNIALGDFIFGSRIKTVDLDAFAGLKREFLYDILFKSNATCCSIREIYIEGSRTVDLNANGKLGAGRRTVRRIRNFLLHFKGTLILISIVVMNNDRIVLVRTV